MMRVLQLLMLLIATGGAVRLSVHPLQNPEEIIAFREKIEKEDTPKLTPVAWVHIPKAGTSIINTLIHHPGVCPHMPKDDYVRWSEHGFWKEHPKSQYCPGGFSETFHSPPGHHGMGQQYEQNKGHVIAFFRQPEERLRSAYHYNQHSWPHKGRAQNISEFHNAVKGCQVRMLTRDSNIEDGHAQCGGSVGGPTRKEDVDEAIRRMNEMDFVGLTDQYDFSICLFHKTYGGNCNDKEFLNTRPSHPFKKEDMGGLKDEFDTPLYEAARAKFWSLMKKHNLDRGACEEMCKDATETKPFSLQEEELMREISDSTQFAYDWPGRQPYDAEEEEELQGF